MKARDLFHLKNMAELVEEVASFASRDRKDLVVFRAVERSMSLIGESAYQLSKECKEAHASVPWDKIAGLRHRLVHEYFSIDEMVLWQIVDIDIPRLKGQIAAILEVIPSNKK